MDDTASSSDQIIVVIFGRPGAGKSTISVEAVRLLTTNDNSSANYLYLDLDVCVPQWMRDNFAKGIYPSLQQRLDFVSKACKYIQHQIQSSPSTKQYSRLVTILSFSFVNTDMRVAFRERYPNSHWILVDTNEDLAEERIMAREGHFYKGAHATGAEDGGTDKKSRREDDTYVESSDRSEWEFQPVDFPHVLLKGCHAVHENAQRIVESVKSFEARHDL